MTDIILGILSQLNNREIAVGVWLAVALLAVLASASLRQSLGGVLKATLASKLLILFSSMALYVAVLVWALLQFHLWTPSQLMATFLWYFLSGLILLSRVFDTKEGDRYFRKTVKGAIAVTGAFEFVVVAFTFSLPVELILVPVLTLFGAMLALSETKPEYRSVRRLFEWVFILFGLVLLWKSIGQIWSEPDAFFTTTTGRNFVLPIFLTIGIIPFLYFWFCYSQIEHARIAINQKTFQSEDLKSYARKRFFLIFMARPWLLKRAVRQFHSLPAKRKSDVNKIINDVLTYERNSENPPAVSNLQGWSPNLAREFLAAQSLRTNDYHAGFGEEEYWANSEYLNLDEQLLPSTAAFYLEGERDVVKTLKLKGHFRDDFDPQNGVERLRDLAAELVAQSEKLTDEESRQILPMNDDFSVTNNLTQIKWRTERYPNDKGFEVYFTLSRRLPPNNEG